MRILSSSLLVISGLTLINTSANADSLWNHNGSVMRLVANGDERLMYYEAPRPGMREQGVMQGTLFFNGQRKGNTYVGIARAFSNKCSAPMEFNISGVVIDDNRIVLSGSRPVFKDCRPNGQQKHEELIFTYLSTVDPVPSDGAGQEETIALEANTVATQATNQSIQENIAATQQVASAVNDAAQLSAEKADEMNKKIADLSAQIATLSKVLEEQKQQQATNTDTEEKHAIDQTIVAINLRIETLQKQYKEVNTVFSQYLTSIQPNDRDLYLSARKASQLYPKVPYYIPGTSEIGEFWVEPKVTDAGELMFNFRLIDPAAENDTTRSLINMNLAQLEVTQSALFKLHKNSVIAHEKKIRENYTKRVACFPTDQCPEERQKGEKGKTSTEVLFMIYEDGSTGGKLQQNKGAFQEGVNFSIDSALLLQAYLAHVISEAKLEFESGTRTQQQLDDMFQ